MCTPSTSLRRTKCLCPVEAAMDVRYDLTKEILSSAAPHHGALPPTYLVQASLVLLPLILIFQSQCWILCLQQDTKIIQMNQWSIVLPGNLVNAATPQTSSGSEQPLRRAFDECAPRTIINISGLTSVLASCFTKMHSHLRTVTLRCWPRRSQHVTVLDVSVPQKDYNVHFIPWNCKCKKCLNPLLCTGCSFTTQYVCGPQRRISGKLTKVWFRIQTKHVFLVNQWLLNLRIQWQI